MKCKRLRSYEKPLQVVEVYTAVQSEGSRQGYPTIVVRTTGCTHRCFFGEGGWCDSWYTSIHPEKGTFCFNDIIKMYDDNPHIKEMMLTGGSPTMHPALVNELTHFANEGAETPLGEIVDEKMIIKHNSKRCNIDAIRQSIAYHKDYHIKPVLDKDLNIVSEVEDLIRELDIPLHKVWAMPAGDDRESLMESYPVVMNFVRDRGWRFTGRSHIMAFNTERCV
jgi:7-carboxy-7-deazaguanine synthase